MRINSLYMRTCSAAAIVSIAGATAYAAAPEAGSVIGNQAVATYQNSSGDTITVTSNKVETIVQQVAGVDMTSNNSEAIAPGGKAFLPHIITNTGNGPDSYALAFLDSTGNFDFSRIVMYPDADMNGVADSATPIATTPTLAPGERFGYILEVSAPADRAAGDTNQVVVTATSSLPSGDTISNTDTLTVSSDAIMEIVKSMTVDSGADGIVNSGDTVTVTLTYSNTGLAPSTDYYVKDALDSRLLYTDDSGRWSDAPTTLLLEEGGSATADATNGASEDLSYWSADPTIAGATIEFQVDTVAPGRTGSVTFKATIAPDVDAGTIYNFAQHLDADRSYPDSNTASIAVDSVYSLDLDSASPDLATVSSTDDVTTVARDNTVTESGDVSQGATIPFEFVLTNTSNQSDSYTLDVANVDFPDGTTFRFVGEDGATPIVGDIGPLALGESTTVTLLATLPSDTPDTAGSAAGYTATVTTTSVASGLTDAADAELAGAVTAAAVDLENNRADLIGDGANPYQTDGTPWVTETADPGQTISFPMKVENLGPTSDSYNLSLATPMPDGWVVEFRLEDGTVVTNTGTIAGTTSTAGSTVKNINVFVTAPEGALPADYPVEIALVSPVSNQGDTVVNQVRVNQIVDLSITEDQTVQAAPGGIVDILHTVSNDGNVTITEGAIAESQLADFSAAVYYDANGNGVIDAGEPVIDNISDIPGGIAPGDTAALIYRVQTPSTATSGVSESGQLLIASALTAVDPANAAGTIAVTDADAANNAVKDVITIVSGDVTLSKYQAIDPLCDGNEGVFTKTRQPVEPGQCVRYRVVAENTGTAAATNVVIKDVAPAYTAITNCTNSCDATPASAAISGSQVSSSTATVNPGSSATLEFTVQVDQ